MKKFLYIFTVACLISCGNETNETKTKVANIKAQEKAVIEKVKGKKTKNLNEDEIEETIDAISTYVAENYEPLIRSQCHLMALSNYDCKKMDERCQRDMKMPKITKLKKRIKQNLENFSEVDTENITDCLENLGLAYNHLNEKECGLSREELQDLMYDMINIFGSREDFYLCFELLKMEIMSFEK